MLSSLIRRWHTANRHSFSPRRHTRQARAPLAAAAIAAAVMIGGCGDSRATLKVSAAASLKTAIDAYAASFDAAAVSAGYAASDELAAQIRRGGRPDVYAAANTELPEALYTEGLVERPVRFATNRLVIAVPRERGAVATLRDLTRPDVKIAAGGTSSPVGGYTRAVLARLDATTRAAIEGNIRSNEPDVSGVAAKVVAGAADAGFVYATDVAAAGGRLRAIDLPARLRPTVVYGAAVVKGGRNLVAARAFVAGLRDGAGRATLARAGFGPPPGHPSAPGPAGAAAGKTNDKPPRPEGR